MCIRDRNIVRDNICNGKYDLNRGQMPTAYFLVKGGLARNLEPKIPEECLVTKLSYHYKEGIARARLCGQIKTIQALLENYEHENYYRRSRQRNDHYGVRGSNNITNNNYRSNYNYHNNNNDQGNRNHNNNNNVSNNRNNNNKHNNNNRPNQGDNNNNNRTYRPRVNHIRADENDSRRHYYQRRRSFDNHYDRRDHNENNHYPRNNDRRSRSSEDSRRRRNYENFNDNPAKRQESPQDNLTNQCEQLLKHINKIHKNKMCIRDRLCGDELSSDKKTVSYTHLEESDHGINH